MVYKHIVLPGGASNGFNDFGAIYYFMKNNLIDIKNIETIHATSVGSLLATVLCLNHDIDEYQQYIINCSMDKIFYIDPEEVMNVTQSTGFINDNCFKDYIKPFFEANNVSIDITLQQFFELTNISLYIYVTEINTMSPIAFSHINNPDLKLFDAIRGSCSLPILFSPLVYNGQLYVDGGFICNYPLNECLDMEGVIPNEVIGINHIYDDSDNEIDVNNYNIFDLIIHIIFCLMNKLVDTILNNRVNKVMDSKRIADTTQIEIPIENNLSILGNLLNSFVSKDFRQQKIEKGSEYGEKYYKTHLQGTIKEL